MSKAIRSIAIVLMAVTAVVTLLAGAGSTCVAFFAERWPGFEALVPYKPLYQALCILSLLVAIVAFQATWALLRGKRRAYLTSVIVLAIALALGAIQMAASNALRGKSAPTNYRVYITAFTLTVFLLLRLPGLWQRTGFGPVSGTGPSAGIAGLACLAAGLVALSTPVWAGANHTIEGIDWIYAFRVPLVLGGGALTLSGLALLAVTSRRRPGSVTLVSRQTAP